MRPAQALVELRRFSASSGPAHAVPGQTFSKIGVLTLKDGTRLEGVSFGAEVNVAGEAVFNTGMVGYPENLTDPSYRGQVLVLTYPLVGNYGVPDRSKLDLCGLPEYFESNKIHISALIVADYSHHHSHWLSKTSLSEWLKEENVPALYGIDTRMLTKKLRDGGASLATVTFNDTTMPFDDPNSRNLVAEVSCTEPKVYGKGNQLKIVALDCGIKHNMIRCLVQRGAEVTVVPYNHPIQNEDYDGLFLSNGPGDPSMCVSAVANIREVINREIVKPVFGICMGNQLLAQAAGAKTYKLPYGNRGQNIPVTDVLTRKCFITPQNHGYAVDRASLPPDYQERFINENDFTNEGIMHKTKPIFSAQFHPEARGGPCDTEYLFDAFIDMARVVKEQKKWPGFRPPIPVPEALAVQDLRSEMRRILLLGSGGLSIGQAGEFDYSGAQAIKALKEEGLQVILMNPNIASVQTNVDSQSLSQADKVYFVPLTAEFVTEVIKKEKPDGVIISMGGQTALNIGVELDRRGVFKQNNVRVLGTPIQSVIWAEDRQAFSDKLVEINEKIAYSFTAETVDEAVAAAGKIGFPVMVRSAYALGGMGSGICDNVEQLRPHVAKALSVAPQVLVERSMLGWKEIEYEVVRDAYDNCITVCNMENFDPLGVHTGDSIVIAPSQTLSNEEYHMLRNTAIKTVRHMGIIGECNIQYALNPHSMEYCIIEINPRLSRSSALASKATGYPLAFIAAKLCLNMRLPELRNSVTKSTTACFEPSLDYIVTKVPRWDLAKFEHVSPKIGSQMKSVGEVMAIGRTWEESVQKALRMVDPFACKGFEAAKGVEKLNAEQILDELVKPTDKRIFLISRVLKEGIYSVEELYKITSIDKWFLYKLKRIVDVDNLIETNTLDSLTYNTLLLAKKTGFSDTQIANRIGSTEDKVRARREALHIRPWVKQIDTLAAEYPAQTNYLYTTYNGSEHDLPEPEKGTIVLGSGAYRIGSSVEFDWCAVSAVRTIRQSGKKVVVINYNPETVSTDYDECDRLYFEELSKERVMDIYQHEQSTGVVVSVGGQIPQNLAMPLYNAGVKILGTSPLMIDAAEDRHKFSQLMDSIGVDQPRWQELTSLADVLKFVDVVGFPVLIRPSYVLSGAAMNVAYSKESLENFLGEAALVSKEHPVVVTEFFDGCREIEMDGVAKNGLVIAQAISEHVEDAGTHSGDATLVLPPHTISKYYINYVKTAAAKIVEALQISGPFNIQFLARDGWLKVIECNLRASRSVPFVSKTVNADFVAAATRVLLGIENTPAHDLPALWSPMRPTQYVGIKAPMFSFARLSGADPRLGVEMSSTGEVACFGFNTQEAYLKALLSTNFRLPNKNILVSSQQRFLPKFVHGVFTLRELGFNIFATERTHAFLKRHNVHSTLLNYPNPSLPAGTTDPAGILNHLRDGKIDLVINMPNADSAQLENNYLIRRTAVDYNVPLLTNLETVMLFIEAIEAHIKSPMLGLQARDLFEYYTKEKSSEKWTSDREFH